MDWWLNLFFKVVVGMILIACEIESPRLLAQNVSGYVPDERLLTADQWKQIDRAVEKSLTWLASKQHPNGSFPSVDGGQPAVTALCVMAFAAHGHLPEQGEYGDSLAKAIDFVIDCQRQSGLLALEIPNTKNIPRSVGRDASNNAVYNHAISATALSELYGLAAGNDKQAQAIEKAIEVSLKMQKWPKFNESELGGWRYLNRRVHDNYQSDLSVTAWELMFLRSARNCGFEVPEEPMQSGVAYVLRTFDPKIGTFRLFEGTHRVGQPSRAMAGAGILALAHSGVHDRPECKRAADFLLTNTCIPYGQDDPLKNGGLWYPDRYHYSAFLATQGMYQMGGKYWHKHFPPTAEALINNQSSDGSWPAEKHHYDSRFGNVYTTSLVTLALGAPNQLLPVFQR